MENQRIVYSMTIDSGAERLTASLVTVEFADAGVTTDLVAILSGGDSAAERERGWGARGCLISDLGGVKRIGFAPPSRGDLRSAGSCRSGRTDESEHVLSHLNGV